MLEKKKSDIPVIEGFSGNLLRIKEKTVAQVKSHC